MNIKTQCICPPIPIRYFDWIAYDDDTYDGSLDSYPIMGYGRTEEEAIKDLKMLLNDWEIKISEEKD